MKKILTTSIILCIALSQTIAQCKNLTFQEIYSLWVSYNNKTIESSLLAKEAEIIEENIYGICYSLIKESESDSVYNYNELFQTSQAVRFSYGTFNKEAYQEIKKHVLSTYQFVGSYLDRGIKFKVYYHLTYKYCILAEMNSGLSLNKPLLLYALEFDNLKPPYSLQIE